MRSKTQFLVVALVVAGFAASTELSTNAQGLIGAPDLSQRKVTTRLELERARVYHHGLKDLKTRIVYGSSGGFKVDVLAAICFRVK